MRSLPRAWRGPLIGAALLVGPISLTLLLTGENEDRLPREARPIAAKAEVISEPPPAADVGQPAEVPLSPSVDAPTEEVATVSEPIAPPKPPQPTPIKRTVPIFAGFENARFQRHDELIAKYVEAFNRNRALWAGSTTAQAEKIVPITAAQVKAHMIQESGGQDALSRAAWKKDPLQVNVPGDWNSYKKYLGLHKPRNRNEGSLETNLKAGIMMLARKGFGESGQPAANRPSGRFDGWRPALQRYNGRSDLAAEGRPYREVYANRILTRAARPNLRVDIPIKKRGTKARH